VSTTSTPRKSRLRCRYIAGAVAFLTAPVLAVAPASTAQADTSCTSQITNRRNVMRSRDYYPATLVIQRDDNSWTSYSAGTLFAAPNGHLKGNFTQTFSDRSYFSTSIGVYQNFNAGSTASHSVDVGPTGLITIHSDTFNSTNSTDMTCAGGLLTKYDGSYKQPLTLTFGPFVGGVY
jgi:hypothetical protein